MTFYKDAARLLVRSVAAIGLAQNLLPAMAGELATQHAPPASELQWRLTGTLVTPAQSIAVFASRKGQTASLVEGDEIDGWTVTAIRSHSATLSANGVTRTITVEGYSQGDEAATLQTTQQKNARVRNNLAQQERAKNAAINALAEATKQMELQKTQP